MHVAKRNCRGKWIDSFSLLDKVIVRGGFWGLPVLGIIATGVHSIRIGILYFLIALVSSILLTRKSFCPYCPYPKKYNDCLVMPIWLVKHIKPAGKRMTLTDKLLTIFCMAVYVIFPQYWLIQSMPLFILFWGVSITLGVYVSFKLCAHCRFVGCPLNRAVAASD